jgi:hypothetical protein
MRRTTALAMGILLLGLGAAAHDALAGATIDLLFTERNGIALDTPARSIGAQNGDELTLAVLLRSDEPLTIAILSLDYDVGGDELDVVAAFQWRGAALNKAASDRFTPLGRLDPSTARFVGSFQGITTNLGLPRTLPASAAGYQMGTVVWRVVDVRSDGTDILSGLFNRGIDIFADAEFGEIDGSVLFHAASVNTIPEPATAVLLGFGLAALGVASRRRRAHAAPPPRPA